MRAQGTRAQGTAPTRTMTRRAAIGALTGAAVMPSALAQPAVRRKVTIAYWTWADNPSHQKMLIDLWTTSIAARVSSPWRWTPT